MGRLRLWRFHGVLLRVFRLAWHACPRETLGLIGLSMVRMTYWTLKLFFTRGIVDAELYLLQAAYYRAG